MRNDNLKSYLNLHLIVFIWGFTAILGALITIDAENLVWFRMLLAGIFLGGFIAFKKQSFQVPIKEFFKLIFVGLLIALHWIFFFKAIHVSNVSITLSIFSLGAFFASLLEPLFYGRKVLWYEVFFWTHNYCRFRIDSSGRNKISSRCLFCFGFYNIGSFIYANEWKINS